MQIIISEIIQDCEGSGENAACKTRTFAKLVLSLLNTFVIYIIYHFKEDKFYYGDVLKHTDVKIKSLLTPDCGASVLEEKVVHVCLCLMSVTIIGYCCCIENTRLLWWQEITNFALMPVLKVSLQSKVYTPFCSSNWLFNQNATYPKDIVVQERYRRYF